LDAAVERAMNVFWSRGYHGTALGSTASSELSRVVVCTPHSAASTPSSCARDRYIAEGLARLDVELDPPGKPPPACRLAFPVMPSAPAARWQRGCLLMATAMELAAHDPASRTPRRLFLQKAMETKLAGALSRAKVQESWPTASGLNCGATAPISAWPKAWP
jgi:TetR/AcrR family transcriptional repressor of nem operon